MRGINNDYKKLFLSCGIFCLPLAAQANWIEAATAVLGAKNAAAVNQAEAQMNQSRLAAANAVKQADKAYYGNLQQNQVYSTSYLKTLDCTDLAVEAKAAQRTLAQAEISSSQANAQANNPVSKWAGFAGSALSAFSGQSETVSKASQIANAFSGQNAQQDLSASQQSLEIALNNLDNIQIYQKAKKCAF